MCFAPVHSACAASGGFCRAFCSPLCCEGSASTRCYQSHRNEAYRHDSPFFHRLTNTSDYGAWSRAGRNGNRVVGIHALDRLSLLSAISQVSGRGGEDSEVMRGGL